MPHAWATDPFVRSKGLRQYYGEWLTGRRLTAASLPDPVLPSPFSDERADLGRASTSQHTLNTLMSPE